MFKFKSFSKIKKGLFNLKKTKYSTIPEVSKQPPYSILFFGTDRISQITLEKLVYNHGK